VIDDLANFTCRFSAEGTSKRHSSEGRGPNYTKFRGYIRQSLAHPTVYFGANALLLF